MIALFIAWLATAIGLGAATLIVPGIKSKNFLAFIITATFLGLINAFIRPALWFLTAPLSVLTLGSSTVVSNSTIICFNPWIICARNQCSHDNASRGIGSKIRSQKFYQCLFWRCNHGYNRCDRSDITTLSNWRRY